MDANIKKQITAIDKEIEQLRGKIQTEYNLTDMVSLHLRNKQLTTDAVKLAIKIENNSYTLIELWYKINDKEIRSLIANRLEELVAKGISLTPKKIADLYIIFQHKINP